ncbi:DUF3696 domain-containing protein [Fibrisoma montanum]|uniref:DUF3696 domain-containing protein n=1 Tax=Fibrisoma montanum TaxID=2305895 RepID=A0A418MEH8_9BACT|nr:DUF3696 domain-containing protein [Fibrisoma montanum]RIV25191.1 DUF3696 domain-containing protein [Fibrisoma montanum]
MPHLSGFGLENFRVFKEYTWFDFAPITLLVGPNNSGKSSLLKALLLLKDNYEKNILPLRNDSLGNSFLTLDGHIHGLFNTNSIKSRSIDNDIFTYYLPTSPLNFINDSEPLSRFINEVITNSTYIGTPPLREGFSFRVFNNRLEAFSKSLYTGKRELIIKFSPDHIYFNPIIFDQEVKKSYCLKPYFDQNNIEYTGIELNIEIDKNALYEEYKSLLSFYKVDLNGIINWFLTVGFDVDNSAKMASLVETTMAKFVETQVLNAYNNDDIALKELYYFTTLRKQTKSYYSEEDKDEIIYLFKNFTQYQHFQNEHNDMLNFFSEILDIKGTINLTHDKDKELYFLTLNGHRLRDFGFGYNQVVSLIILFAVKAMENYDYVKEHKKGYYVINSTLLLEEPEANLHPKLQSLLADLFAQGASRGVHSIVETHSEYIIRKLQYLTAKGTIKPEDTVIYYFNDPNNIPPGEKQVKKINILEDGSLSDDFGPGFFDEAAHWELELLKLKRNKSRHN